ncbi:MAG: pentapeptide repeat-containing protein [Alphaproteobacteria bacterium]|nr:pentapeptide repeat-containing protein [Alphaproteobacteria bacterium]
MTNSSAILSATRFKEKSVKIEIKNRWNGAVIFSHEAEENSIAITINKMVADARAKLARADLARADLTDADLTDANLTDADLTPIRDDIWAVLSSAPREVPALIQALKDGRVDGSTYQGECSCLVGTIAMARGVFYGNLEGLKANSSRPAERFFMGIRRGDTPETSQFSALALKWSQDWLDAMRSAFGQ